MWTRRVLNCTEKDMRIAIVDDEKKWREEALHDIKRYYQGDDVIIDTFTGGEQLLLGSEEYDLLFLDVDMKGMDGFETGAKYKENHPETILVMFTTHTELSRRGYLINAFRYIDKMNMANEILEALKSIDRLLECNQAVCINVVNLGEIPFVLKNILYIETEKRNVKIHTRTGDFVSSDNISGLEKILEPYGFYRCHKSYIVNLDGVKFFDHKDVLMVDGSRAMVSNRKYAELKQKYLERRFENANG